MKVLIPLFSFLVLLAIACATPSQTVRFRIESPHPGTVVTFDDPELPACKTPCTISRQRDYENKGMFRPNRPSREPWVLKAKANSKEQAIDLLRLPSNGVVNLNM